MSSPSAIRLIAWTAAREVVPSKRHPRLSALAAPASIASVLLLMAGFAATGCGSSKKPPNCAGICVPPKLARLDLIAGQLGRCGLGGWTTGRSALRGPVDLCERWTGAALSLRYFDGPGLSQVAIKFHGYSEGYNTYFNDIVYLAAKPGKYDLLDFLIPFNGGKGGFSFPINTVIELKAGKAYYAGEVVINTVMNIEEGDKYTYSVFNQNVMSDVIIHDFETKYPNTFNTFKDDFISATFSLPTPLQPTKVIFLSHFVKSEGIWNESNDSLHIASYENGQYCIEGKSGQNLGAEIIELPEKLGNTFEIELRCNWKTGLNNSPYGFIIPGHQFADPKCPEGEVEPRGYIFGISSNGFACIWYEGLYYNKEKHKILKATTGLTNWKNIPSIKTNGSGQNTIRVQVIDKVITYYVNDMFVSRAPHNYFPGLEKFVDFLYPGNKLLGIYSSNKQKIEFDEIKVSTFQ